MAVKIRLQRHGRGKRPFYHIVVADSRSRRDGRFIERIGDYNPLSQPATINVSIDKAVDWLQKGAEPTETVNAILKYKGVLYKKHLLRGVTKGVLTAEQAEAKFIEWVDSHKNAVLDHSTKLKKAKEDKVAKLLEQESKIKADRDAKRSEALKAANATESEEAPAEETAPETEAPVAEAAEETAEKTEE
jgi:small subunit ribosomal protein S16